MTRAVHFHRKAPWEPLFFAGLLLFLALIGLATGILDIAVPTLKGEPIFSNLQEAVARWGFLYLFFHVFLHNLGLACIVPGIGLFAAHLEPDPRLRRVIGPILAIAVALSLGVAATWVVRSGAYAHDTVLLIFGLEAAGVILLSAVGLRALNGYVPTPTASWSLHQPTHRIAPYLAVTSILIGMAAFIEAVYVARLMG